MKIYNHMLYLEKKSEFNCVDYRSKDLLEDPVKSQNLNNSSGYKGCSCITLHRLKSSFLRVVDIWKDGYELATKIVPAPQQPRLKPFDLFVAGVRERIEFHRDNLQLRGAEESSVRGVSGYVDASG